MVVVTSSGAHQGGGGGKSSPRRRGREKTGLGREKKVHEKENKAVDEKTGGEEKIKRRIGTEDKPGGEENKRKG